MIGYVTSVNVSNGGVPKNSVKHAFISREGLEGDDWNDKKIHGGLEQAVCLFSSEVLDDLNSKGFRVIENTPNPRFENKIGTGLRHGDLGENLTTIEINYAMIRIGYTYLVGSAIIKITKPRQPCQTIYEVFGPHLGKAIYDNGVEHLDFSSPMWGRSGFYASVLREGEVISGSTIERVD